MSMDGPPQLPQFRQQDRPLSHHERDRTSIPREKPSAKGILGTLAGIGLLLAKYFAAFAKFLPVILKSGGSMIAMIGVYSLIFGWKWAVGFVVLLLLHECGHLLAAKYFGLNVSAPMFIPFMGAFIALRDAPQNAWVESWVGISGPLLGSASALVCHGLGIYFNSPLLIALASTGYWLNLFNLIPLGQLDGGHIATALSPWLFIPGLGVMSYLAWHQYTQGRLNFLIILIILLSLPRLITLFRKRTDEEQRFYEILPSQRWTMGALYFALMAALAFGMHVAEENLHFDHGVKYRQGDSAQVEESDTDGQ